MKEFISTQNAAKPIGPYSQGIIAQGKFIFISGQIPIDTNGSIVGEDIKAQTKQVILNIKAILESIGASLDNIVKTTVYLSDMNNFSAMNEVYEEFLGSSKPARAAFQVARLPKDVLVEIEAIAVVE